MNVNRNYIIIGGVLLALFGSVVGFIVGSESQRTAAASAIAKADTADKEIASAKKRFDEYSRETSATIEAATKRADEAESRASELASELKGLQQKPATALAAPQPSQPATVPSTAETKPEPATNKKLDRVIVKSARFYRDKDGFLNEPTISLTVRNDTGRPIKRIFFHGISQTPGRTLPWVDDDFNYSPDGGMEAGEELSWKLTTGILSAFSKADIHDDAKFTVTVRDVEFAK